MTAGRPYNSSSPLGRMIKDAGLRVKDVSWGTGIYDRTLSDYLAERKEISDGHLVTLCDFFDCEPEEILGSSIPS